MKKIFLVLITLLLLLTGCSKKESNQVSNENISTSIEEQEAEGQDALHRRPQNGDHGDPQAAGADRRGHSEDRLYL